VIVGILLKLNKFPVLNTSYKSRYESVANELLKIRRPPYNVKDVYQAIVNIRKRKLPDISRWGSVGSVFKNPLITQEQLEKVKKLCPDIHYYPANHLTYTHIDFNSGINDEMVKIPAAWLIEEMGWAGKRVRNCGIWKTQPLNIVNYGNATPKEYLSFINMVKDAVFNKYSITLYPEVVIV
jgi:UDP-N-acetylmuramate dehydrogenase